LLKGVLIVLHLVLVKRWLVLLLSGVVYRLLQVLSLLSGIRLVVRIKSHEHATQEVNDVLLQEALGVLMVVGKQLFNRTAYRLLLMIVVFKSHLDVFQSHVQKNCS